MAATYTLSGVHFWRDSQQETKHLEESGPPGADSPRPSGLPEADRIPLTRAGLL